MKLVLLMVMGSALLLADGSATVPTSNTPKGVYVMAEEGVTMNGAFASISIVTFSETGVVTAAEVSRTTTGVARTQYSGSLILQSRNIGMLVLRSQTTDAEENAVTLERSYQVAIGQTGMQAVRSGVGVHAIATLTEAADPEHTGTFLFAEAGREKPSCRVVMVELDRAGTVNGVSMGSHPMPESTPITGRFANGESGFHDLSLTVTNEDGEGNVVTTTESYAAAFGKDRITILRTDGGPIKLSQMNR